MFSQVGPPEILIILVIILLVLGPRRVIGFGRLIGKRLLGSRGALTGAAYEEPARMPKRERDVA